MKKVLNKILLLSLMCSMSLFSLAEDTTEVYAHTYSFDGAPGQFSNVLPSVDSTSTLASTVTKVDSILEQEGMITLGSYGGNIVFKFATPIYNSPGLFDILIKGNAFSGSSEPGIICVMKDDNNDGLPNDTWYELVGAADTAAGNIYNYTITYQKPDESDGVLKDIPWTDSEGMSDTLPRNSFHSQTFYPLLAGSTLSFTGTKLPQNYVQNGNFFTGHDWGYGYVDNKSNNNPDDISYKFDWAVDPITRAAVTIDRVDFIKVYSGTYAINGWLGEESTEVCSLPLNLHPDYIPSHTTDLSLSPLSVTKDGTELNVCNILGQSCQLYDIQGRLLDNKRVQNGEVQFSIASLKGLYIVKCDSQVKKIVL